MVEQTLKLFTLDKTNYIKFRDEIIELYIQAFTTGDFAQLLTRDSVVSTLDEIIDAGQGLMAFIEGKLVGMLAATPLIEHLDYQFDGYDDIEECKAIYINELMVHSEFRGRGIADKILRDFLEKTAYDYSYAVIRVWEKNVPALSLYKKFGFKQIARITQKKQKSTGDELLMDKIYLYKKLHN